MLLLVYSKNKCFLVKPLKNFTTEYVHNIVAVFCPEDHQVEFHVEIIHLKIVYHKTSINRTLKKVTVLKGFTFFQLFANQLHLSHLLHP